MINQTPKANDARRMRKLARQLLAGGIFADEPLRRSGTLLQALPVIAPGGKLHSWLVPITVGDRLAAFFQLLPDGVLMRFSSFQRRPGEIAGCPIAADWLDPTLIKGRVEIKRGIDEKAAEPFLTYDRTPDRIVWAVPLVKSGGEVRHVYVTGETAFEPSPGESVG